MEPVHIEQFRIPLIQAHGSILSGKAGSTATICARRTLERREVFGLARGDIGLIEMEVFVTADILDVEDVLAVGLPEIAADSAKPVVRDHAAVAGAERAHPHVEHAIVGREIG